MKRKCLLGHLGLLMLTAVFAWGGVAPQTALALTDQEVRDQVRLTGIADINGAANWAYSPPLQKFVDDLPGLCGSTIGPNSNGTNSLGQCIPVGEPDQVTYPGSDYYEIEIVQFREQMHSDLPALVGGDATTASEGGTLLRGYRQTNIPSGRPTWAATPHNLGVTIVAQKNRPVRLKFTNRLPTGDAGDLFIPTDTTIMGSGPGPLHDRTGDSRTDEEVCQAEPGVCFSQNRATLHLHGGRTPWISDGTAHQWITPKDEITGARDPYYSKGVSVSYVPDMWYNANGDTITECAGKTSCSVAGATNNPGKGSQTYYWTNAQSARLMFYHEHAWGITRLGVYAGGVAGYLITDSTETKLAQNNLIPDENHTLPLIIQDKTFVDPDTIVDDVTNSITNGGTDPTWIWGSKPGSLRPAYSSVGAEPVKGDLWWPHVYVPAQNPFNPDFTGINPFGRWHYGPWFWPPTNVSYVPIANPYYDGIAGEQATKALNPEPPQIPNTPKVSWGAEAFLDTPVINGTAYPKLDVEATIYRFRILNGAHDRFWNLQFYVADATNPTEVTMVPAVLTSGFPGDGDGDFSWPTDGREGGVPDPTRRGPAMVQIGTEGGFLPAPVKLLNRPVKWNTDATTFTAGNVLPQNQGGGTLFLGPGERADVIVDFSQFAGRTIILYNDAPAPFPAIDPHYDYYTDDQDNTDIGGAKSTSIGYGPNTRTLMQIVVAGTPDSTPGPVNEHPTTLTALVNAFNPLSLGGLGIFDEGQEPIIVGQSTYNTTYNRIFPATWPNWGLSRITDTSLSFMTPDGAIVSNYPMEPKAIQDEMGEVFDDFGRMSAKLGLELAHTTAGIQTFVLQNFVDPPTEIVQNGQVQIWKITHNGVDTHSVHFHLFEVQLLNRVGWDGFIYPPDPNELGWKDTIRISPLEDTIVALRPAKVPTPFTVPNSRRPLNPAFPLGVPAGFTNIDPKTAAQLTTPVINEVVNFGHEYLWHCHILSHEEQDMMRPLVLNADSLLYTLNGANGLWQWSRGDWSQITTAQPTNIISSGTFAYGTITGNGLWEWNGYTWKQITAITPTEMAVSESVLYVTFSGYGLYQWKNNTWTRLSSLLPTNLVASCGNYLYANFAGYGVYQWNGTAWIRLSSLLPSHMVASGANLFANFTGYGLYQWAGTAWERLSPLLPTNMVASGVNLYASFTGRGVYQWTGTAWIQLGTLTPTTMAGSGSALYATYSGYGLYKWNGTAWSRLDTTIPVSMVASGSILYANFGGVNGVRKWEFGAWSSLLNTSAATNITAGY